MPATTRPPAQHVPVAVLVRGDLVEGVHHGSMAVLGPGGEPLAAVGDVEAPVYPRSALKPLQSVAMLRHGLDLPADLLAVATSSHSGEDVHLAAVRRVLELGGFGPDDLRNAPDLPLGELEHARWRVAGRAPERLAQNCSGKHAAMLLTCRVNGWDPATYLDPAHPLQRAVADTVAELTGAAPAAASTDGCGAPLFAVPLTGLARAAGRLAAADAGTPEGRVADAVRSFPELVAGEGRDTTALLRAVPGIVAKDGVEAVQVAALPDGSAVAVKIADGGARARMPVAAVGLALLGVAADALAPFASQPVLGGGAVVGELRGLPLPGTSPGDAPGA
ncbi:asparaginase [Kineococcus terrestris]|uniref:asparaginase n=1 Tax=Kineococcus terrestris TaxID=2044856 RepID=UPI0034DB1BA0